MAGNCIVYSAYCIKNVLYYLCRRFVTTELVPLHRRKHRHGHRAWRVVLTLSHRYNVVRGHRTGSNNSGAGKYLRRNLDGDGYKDRFDVDNKNTYAINVAVLHKIFSS